MMIATNPPILWHGLEFETDDADVYAPKPASFLLAEHASKLVRPGERVLDACTGSGVVGIAVAKSVSGASVVVADINESALAAARRNAERNGVAVEVVYSSLYDRFADGEFDVITVHPPAVPYPDGGDWGLSQGMRVATHGGDDGSALVIRSIAESRRALKPGGRFLLLLPHWSHVKKAWSSLLKHYIDVTELARKQVEFFPVTEGKPDAALLRHVKKLAAAGDIDMTFENEVPLSIVSVVQGFAS
ncbi:MAG: methyltransferase [Verrucomicrobiae bacterium]